MRLISDGFERRSLIDAKGMPNQPLLPLLNASISVGTATSARCIEISELASLTAKCIRPNPSSYKVLLLSNAQITFSTTPPTEPIIQCNTLSWKYWWLLSRGRCLTTYGAYVKILVAVFSRTVLNAFTMVHCFSLMTVGAGITSSSTPWKKIRTQFCLSEATGKNSLTW